MKLLLSDYGGYAFIYDLSRALARRGHEVIHVYTSDSASPQGDFISENSLTVVNLRLPFDRKAGFLPRWAAERAYGKMAADLLQKERPDVILAADTPLEALRHIFAASRRCRIPFVFWWQDILSDAMAAVLGKKLGVIGYAVGSCYRQIEKRCLQQSAGVIAVAEQFIERLRDWGIRQPNLHLIRNWASPDTIRPLPKDNEFSRRYGLMDRFVVLYAGTFGMKQNPQTLIDAAKYLKSIQEILFVVAADGVALPFLQAKKRELQLDNLLILPLQPFRDLPLLLASGDVHLVLLNEDAARYSVPSKIWTACCAGRPILITAPETSDAARYVRRIGVGEAVQTASDLAAAVQQLRRDEALRMTMGENGRRYAEQNFRLSTIAERFEFVLNEARKMRT
ncbi:MAG: glycosyltransferase family 4 protein [candidate division KSB1 bacterium]|nr:glycosyltransferase family 4 protein [candidate division KSB1 bacterium]